MPTNIPMGKAAEAKMTSLAFANPDLLPVKLAMKAIRKKPHWKERSERFSCWIISGWLVALFAQHYQQQWDGKYYLINDLCEHHEYIMRTFCSYNNTSSQSKKEEYTEKSKVHQRVVHL